MKLSISTCATERRIVPDGFEFAPLEGLKQCKDAGFRYVDFNFAHAAEGGRPLSRPDWESWVESVRETLAERGLCVEQTHAHWFHLNDLHSQEELQWHDEMVRRSIISSARLGENPWVVVHPRSIFKNGEFDLEKTKAYNYETCMRLGDIAAKCGSRIAVENLFCNGNIGHYSAADELVELMELLNSDIYGVCWDFGHANRAGVDHLKSLEIVAPYLRVTHCHDNKRRSDDHFIPYFGTVPWKNILPKLKEIGYAGNLNMEVHVFYNSMPQEMRMNGLRFMREVGENLIDIFEKA